MTWAKGWRFMGLIGAATLIAWPLRSTVASFSTTTATSPFFVRAISLPSALPLEGQSGAIAPSGTIRYGTIVNDTHHPFYPTVDITLTLSSAFPPRTPNPALKSTQPKKDVQPPDPIRNTRTQTARRTVLTKAATFQPETWQAALVLLPGSTDTLLFAVRTNLVPGIYQAVVTVYVGGFSESTIDTFTVPLVPRARAKSDPSPTPSPHSSASSQQTPSRTPEPGSHTTNRPTSEGQNASPKGDSGVSFPPNSRPPASVTPTQSHRSPS